MDDQKDTYSAEKLQLCSAITGPRATFAQIKSVLDALLHEFGLKAVYQEIDHPFFIEGRGAKALVEQEGKEVFSAIIGEIHPEILNSFSIIQPVAAFETTLNPLMG